MEISAFEIQQIVQELIDNVEEPRFKGGHAYRYSVYKKWAGEQIICFIFYQLDYLEIYDYFDLLCAAERFRDVVSVYSTWNRGGYEIFQAARDMADELIDIFTAMK